MAVCSRKDRSVNFEWRNNVPAFGLNGSVAGDTYTRALTTSPLTLWRPNRPKLARLSILLCLTPAETILLVNGEPLGDNGLITH